MSYSVWIEPARDGCATCPGRSFVKSSRWAQSAGSSLTFVSSLNFLWIYPRVMNQKILGFWWFCYEFLGVCNSVTQKQLFWLEMTWNWVWRSTLGGKYFLRDFWWGAGTGRKQELAILSSSELSEKWFGKEGRETCQPMVIAFPVEGRLSSSLSHTFIKKNFFLIARYLL